MPRYASAEELRKAFQAQALKCHPDVNPSPEAARDFQRLREAYEFLKSGGGGGSGAYGPYSSSSPSGGGSESSERLKARAEAFRAKQAAAREEAEAMRLRRGQAHHSSHRAFLSTLNFLFQPRVLLVAVPVLAYLCYSMVVSLANKQRGAAGGAQGPREELIMAVFNKDAQRWEMPTHRDYFHERLVLVRRGQVHPSSKEEPAPFGRKKEQALK